MIEFIKSWANQIIVAVIIATIMEMILPNGNNKKYIKMVIGIYVLFIVIQPIANKLTGNKFNISEFNYEKYLNGDILETSSKDFENNNSNLIKQAYIDNIKNDIKNKLQKKGYNLLSCEIDIVTDENKEEYGQIEHIVLKLETLKETKEKGSNVEVEKIEVNISENNEVIQESSLIDSEKIEVIEYISQEYSIDKKIIVIN